MAFANEVAAVGQGQFTGSASPRATLGTRIATNDGRVFRYCQAGGGPLTPGTVCQGPATLSQHLANTPPVVPVGATSFVYTPGAIGVVANYYTEGILQVDTAPGAGYSYVIAGHDAVTSSTPFVLNLRDPIQVGLTGTSRVGLVPNPYSGVIPTPATTASGLIAGVATYPLAAGEYGWLQTWGLCSCVIVGTPALGATVVSPCATIGAVDVITTTNLVTAQRVGRMAQVGAATGKFNMVFLEIGA